MPRRNRRKVNTGTVTVIETYEVDMARQVQALLLVLGYRGPQTTMPPGGTIPEGTHDDTTFANQQRRDHGVSLKEPTDDTPGNLPKSSSTD